MGPPSIDYPAGPEDYSFRAPLRNRRNNVGQPLMDHSGSSLPTSTLLAGLSYEELLDLSLDVVRGILGTSEMAEA